MIKKQFKSYLLLVLAAMFIVSCTDLEIAGTDSVITSDAGGTFTGVEDVAASLDNVFNGLNRLGDQANYFALQEVATDELSGAYAWY